MATTRRRSAGFDPTPEVAEPEFASLTELLEETRETEEVEHSPVFVEEFIAPSDDFGPRFVEDVVEPTPEPPKTVPLKPAPKRHPRNVPRFSRTR